MKCLKNEDGVALVTSLMLTLISLGIVMCLMLMITRSTTVSGMNKKYKSSLEAAYGGTEMFTKDILPMMLRNFDNAQLITDVESGFSGVGLSINTTNLCIQNKLSTVTSAWDASCSKTSNPAQNPDLTFKLTAVTGNPYIVYAKIVDTQVGNTDRSGLQLEGSGVAESSTVITPQHFPFVYRLEIQGAQSNNSSGVKSNIEVLYAY